MEIRPWQSQEEHTYQVGPTHFRVVFNGPESCYIDFRPNRDENNQPIIINRVPYYISAHLTLNEGRWQVGKDHNHKGWEYPNSRDCWMSRADNKWPSDATFSAKENAIKMLEDWINKVLPITNDEVKRHMFRALMIELNNKAHQLEEEISKLDMELCGKKSELSKVNAQIAQVMA